MEQRQLDLQKKYGKSSDGNFYVVDTIGIPHPYCITPSHVSHAADNFGGMLSSACIEDGENKRIATCGICKGKKRFKDHKQALLVECKEEITDDEHHVVPELHNYMLVCKELCEKDGYEGFSFVKAK
jgi:hypothetical protein